MGLRGWPLTVIVVAAALATSLVLWQLGVFFFFLPIVFVPFLRLKFKPEKIPVCRNCGTKSKTKYCPNCGKRLQK